VETSNFTFSSSGINIYFRCLIQELPGCKSKAADLRYFMENNTQMLTELASEIMNVY
jgi:hypothetical protein